MVGLSKRRAEEVFFRAKKIQRYVIARRWLIKGIMEFNINLSTH